MQPLGGFEEDREEEDADLLDAGCGPPGCFASVLGPCVAWIDTLTRERTCNDNLTLIRCQLRFEI